MDKLIKILFRSNQFEAMLIDEFLDGKGNTSYCEVILRLGELWQTQSMWDTLKFHKNSKMRLMEIYNNMLFFSLIKIKNVNLIDIY